MATACVLNGRLYVMGGHGCNKLQVLEMSEENEFTWTAKADLPLHERFSATSVAFEGRVLLMGGGRREEGHLQPGFNSSVSIYDPASDSWSAGPVFPDGSALPAAVFATVLVGEIHAISHGGLWAYRNAAWIRLAGARSRKGSTVETVLLG